MVITCRICNTEHLNLTLGRGQRRLCGAPYKSGTCTHYLTYRDKSYKNRYDKFSFASARKPVSKPNVMIIHVSRSKSAPPMASWPFLGMSNAITYVSSTTSSMFWSAPGPTDILLPFKSLNVLMMGSQGMIIDYPLLSAFPSARAHFDAITLSMTNAAKAQDITEAVGEAAAAMYVMGHYTGYELLWGFDVHSGAGIDQIWWDKNTSNPHYLIVEAKGPTAGLSLGALGNPPGYEQMEKLWVVDRLGRMRSGVGQQIANDILNALALDITVAHPSWGGGSKSYYGCAARKHAVATGTVSGLTLTAKWCADGMLDAKAKNHAYAFP